jgi:tRNA (mo5U34)-methyltransferase
MSMGVLYHRKSPIEHLETLRPLLREGGTLVLETLVIPGDAQTVLVPADRYAAMRNVWMIPSVDAACGWLRRCGYSDVVVADVTHTSVDEQRATEFMTSASLRDFLDPSDPHRTIEGYPAPCRALFVARR